MSAAHHVNLEGLIAKLKAGAITRREFIARGMALGISMSMLGWFVQSVQITGAAPHPQDASLTAPAAGSEGKTRGQDGELKILLWQAPTTLSQHQSAGVKDILASSLISEPLLHYLPDATIIPNLVKEVPTIANGLLSEDLTSVTFNLLEDVVWSDGTPFTAADVVFTWQWVTNPENNATTSDTFAPITSVEALSDYQVQVTYESTNLNWQVPFAANQSIYPQHYIEANGPEIMKTAPIGTGPFVVTDFRPNDQIIFEANPNYRDPNKPYFSRVNIKGGGDAATAAQSVLQTGDWDHAWNLQIEPELVAQYVKDAHGRFRVLPGSTLEWININFSDPNTEGPEGQRSWYENPHPVLSDPAVRQALNLAIDRDLIAERFYAGPPNEPATANVLNYIPGIVSPNTSYAYDLEQAAQILEEAGWVQNGNVREKDGVKLQIDLTTTTNSVRQKTQQVIKQSLESIGFEIELKQVDSAIFFDGSPGNEQGASHMYYDLTMVAAAAVLTPLPIEFMLYYYAGPNNENIAQQSNGWSGTNTIRYINPEYDAIVDRLRSGEISDIAEAQQALIQLNDIVINDVAIIPLVNRAAENYAHHESLFHGDEDNVAKSPFEYNLWNIANWNRSTPIDR